MTDVSLKSQMISDAKRLGREVVNGRLFDGVGNLATVVIFGGWHSADFASSSSATKWIMECTGVRTLGHMEHGDGLMKV